MKKNNVLVAGLLMISIVLAGCSTSKTIEDDTTNPTVPVIPANCTNWFDGCNNCFVEGGKIGGCTRMACETMQEAKCTTFESDETVNTATSDIVTTENVVPENCTSWFDGCNNCMVESGKVTACTMMYCETPTEAKCTQFKK